MKTKLEPEEGAIFYLFCKGNLLGKPSDADNDSNRAYPFSVRDDGILVESVQTGVDTFTDYSFWLQG